MDDIVMLPLSNVIALGLAWTGVVGALVAFIFRSQVSRMADNHEDCIKRTVANAEKIGRVEQVMFSKLDIMNDRCLTEVGQMASLAERVASIHATVQETRADVRALYSLVRNGKKGTDGIS